MMKLIILMILFCSEVNAQYHLQWYSVYNNPTANYHDWANGIVQDKLGNVYVTGTSHHSTGEDWRYDFVTIKYNSNGDSLWVRRYDSPGNDFKDDATSIGIDDMSNIYVAGNSMSYFSIVTIKYDTDGNIIWLRSFEDSSSHSYVVSDMAVDGNGDAIVVCRSFSSDIKSLIIKYNPKGEKLWTRVYQNPENDMNVLYSVTIDNSGDIIATGCNGDGYPDDRNFLTVKYSSNGSLLWERQSADSLDEAASCVKCDNLGNVYIGGYSNISNNNSLFNLIKYDASGNQIWKKEISNVLNSGYGYSERNLMALDNDGNIYADYVIKQPMDMNEIATAKFSTSGDLMWMNSYRIPNSSRFVMATDIKLNGAGYVVTCGFDEVSTIAGNSFAILKYDTSGVLKKIIGNDDNLERVFYPVGLVVNSIGDIVATGSSLQTGTSQVLDYLTVKYSTSVGYNSISENLSPNIDLYQNYPNPFNPMTTIKYELPENGNVLLKVFDINGKDIVTLIDQRQSRGAHSADFNGENISSGIYFYSLRSGNYFEVKKMLLIK